MSTRSCLDNRLSAGSRLVKSRTYCCLMLRMRCWTGRGLETRIWRCCFKRKYRKSSETFQSYHYQQHHHDRPQAINGLSYYRHFQEPTSPAQHHRHLTRRRKTTLLSAGGFHGLTITTASLTRTSRRASGTITNASALLSPASHRP
ncbi:hypothetical protein E4T38_08045 [Aureobasidium subglaciale]|nr:hypothetical protein E4T38_08045 [Aureobasidium subglaciale]KAI5216213.1 hypothetical protein E4T40_08055 [Aureobasidium subglaciale]KAI5219415.1 hypothetical protein E4T41_07970 [Aureobasidium subglaciale]KAI5256918.1 hypothetical protein E4T46_07946 [Aureobasidium subglaciale]